MLAVDRLANCDRVTAIISRPDTVPTRSNSVLVSGYHYNSAGLNDEVTDPRGLVTHSDFDALARTTKTIADYVGDGTPTNSTNQTTTYQYNGLNQTTLTSQAQSHSGPVTSTTPAVQYTYRQMADGANDSRLLSMTYPNGRVLSYLYGGLWGSISQPTVLSGAEGSLETYTYLGAGSIVARTHPYAGTNLSTTLDDFGRVADQKWTGAGGGTTDEFQYGYDADSNVLYEANNLAPSHSELYHASGSGNGYDGLGRMVGFARGTLTSAKDTISGTPAVTQSWSLDAVGNWNSVTTNGSTQSRTSNGRNEITSISGATTPAYDSAGNTTTDEAGQTYVYDGWNRLVGVKDSSGTVIAGYGYDALGRRVSENGRDLYYSGSEIVEERDGGDTVAQNVWSLAYVDALVCRDVDADGNSATGALGHSTGNATTGLDTRYYVQQDANWNVTAVVDGTPGSASLGSVLERYEYDPYGKVTVLNPDFTAKTVNASTYGWLYYEQGGRMDVATGNLHFGAREYRPSLGRWLQVDPIGYGDGMDPYQYEHSSPAGGLDPGGMANQESSLTLFSDLPMSFPHTVEEWNRFNRLSTTERRAISERYVYGRAGRAGFDQTMASAAAACSNMCAAFDDIGATYAQFSSPTPPAKRDFVALTAAYVPQADRGGAYAAMARSMAYYEGHIGGWQGSVTRVGVAIDAALFGIPFKLYSWADPDGGRNDRIGSWADDSREAGRLVRDWVVIPVAAELAVEGLVAWRAARAAKGFGGLSALSFDAGSAGVAAWDAAALDPALDAGESVPTVLFRADTRCPAEIFPAGFTTWGDNMNILEHVQNARHFGSGYVATTTSFDVASNWYGDWKYLILGREGVSVNSALEAAGRTDLLNAFSWQHEIAVPGGIPSRGIIGAVRAAPGGYEMHWNEVFFQGPR